MGASGGKVGQSRAAPDPPGTEIGHERVGDDDRPIRLLTVFQEGHEGPAYCEPGAVQRVSELDASGGQPVPQFHPAGLEVAAGRAGADLSVATLARQPDLDVVGLRSAEPHVRRA